MKNFIINSPNEEISGEVLQNLETSGALVLISRTKDKNGQERTRYHINDDVMIFYALTDYAAKTGKHGDVLHFIRRLRAVLNSAEAYIEKDLELKSKLN